MGLGKTLQVVTLTHTLLTHDELGFTKGMVLCPLNVCLNWVDEFTKWTPSDSVDVYELSQIKVGARASSTTFDGTITVDSRYNVVQKNCWILLLEQNIVMYSDFKEIKKNF